uniref:Ribosomal protein eL8/eL30/eS12/Gadd45 domain-containing protein n=2 Tax=Otolemur garnettii TaxID=30611 RepID=H0Y2A3_OTOGA
GHKKDQKSSELISLRLQLIMKSLKYTQTLKMVRQGEVKLVTLANTCPALRQSEIEHSAMFAKNTDVGTARGKYYRLCTLAVTDPGDSDTIRSIPGRTGEK